MTRGGNYRLLGGEHGRSPVYLAELCNKLLILLPLSHCVCKRDQPVSDSLSSYAVSLLRQWRRDAVVRSEEARKKETKVVIARRGDFALLSFSHSADCPVRSLRSPFTLHPVLTSPLIRDPLCLITAPRQAALQAPQKRRR